MYKTKCRSIHQDRREIPERFARTDQAYQAS